MVKLNLVLHSVESLILKKKNSKYLWIFLHPRNCLAFFIICTQTHIGHLWCHIPHWYNTRLPMGYQRKVSCGRRSLVCLSCQQDVTGTVQCTDQNDQNVSLFLCTFYFQQQFKWPHSVTRPLIPYYVNHTLVHNRWEPSHLLCSSSMRKRRLTAKFGS